MTELRAELRESGLVIIGAGLAGLATALAAANQGQEQVTVLTKTSALGSGSSWWAQGGVAAVWGEDDDVATHVADTLDVGDGLGDPAIARLLAQDGPQVLADLIEHGMEFDRNGAGDIDLAREGGHSRRRILHAGGDATGRALTQFLLRLAGETPAITIERSAFAWDLVIRDGRVAGLLAYHEDAGWIYHRTANVVIAAGGSGQLFGRTTNPAEATADGIALAARAGAALKDLEMVQFHPTALAAGPTGQDRTPLLTEALRGEGAVLIDETGARLMAGVHPLGDLAPRDVVARQVAARIGDGHSVYLDTRPALGAAIAERFPTVYTQCLEAGVDPVRDPIKVAPAAHYHMGGVETDRDGRTDVAGLWACGEATCSGLHGANRMAGNSLLECLLFGRRVAEAVTAGGLAKTNVAELPPPPERPKSATVPVAAAMRKRLQTTMYDGVGLFRNATSLSAAAQDLAGLSSQIEALAQVETGVPVGDQVSVRGWGELRNMALAGSLITWAALHHRGCRGAHYRTDFPDRAADWQRRVTLSEINERAA